MTTIRKITGDLSALRDELRVFLNKQNDEVKINSLTSHVIVKVSRFIYSLGKELANNQLGASCGGNHRFLESAGAMSLDWEGKAMI